MKEIYQKPLEEQITLEDIQANKLFSILCYFGIFVIIPLLAKPNSKYLRFHSNQGIILLIAQFILSLIAIIPILGWIISVVGGITLLVLSIMGIINGITGKVKRLPLIGKYNILE